MKLYSAIDLHSNNHVLTIIDEHDRRVFERRLENNLALTLQALTPYQDQLCGIAVESTYNWYANQPNAFSSASWRAKTGQWRSRLRPTSYPRHASI